VTKEGPLHRQRRESIESAIAGNRFLQLALLVLALWTASYTRSIIGPLQVALQGSLSLSDNQIALLQGMAMALPMALGSLPFGILADRASRARIIFGSVAVALVSCVLSALASNYGELLAARSLAGLASSAILPAAYSMASDLFDAGARGRATTVMGIAETAGAPVSFALGGALLALSTSVPELSLPQWQLVHWRWALLWMAALVAPITATMLVLREPARHEVKLKKPPLRTIWPEFWQYRKVAIPLQLARATVSIADGAIYVWGAPLFARRFHLPAGRTGALMGVALLAGGLAGPALGGPLVDFCQRRGGSRDAMMVLAGVALLSVPAAFYGIMANAALTGVMLAVFLALGYTIAVAAVALTITVIPGELRGLNLGVSVVIGSVFYIGLAPLVVSALSTSLGGPASLGEALTVVCVAASALNAVVLAWSARYFPRNTARRIVM
jgi:MFS family permease